MSSAPKKATKGRTQPTTKVIPFNPLERRVLGAAIAEVLLTTPIYSLDVPFPYRGPGIYALYYSGDFAAYSKLALRNSNGQCSWPIYVGQALPGGGRRGIDVNEDGTALRSRIRKHFLSIRAANDLDPTHFKYRALVMDDTFIRLGETSLLALYKPIWNNYVDGFGNNQPGVGREASIRSRWDTLHGGRSQAVVHQNRVETRELIMQEIERELNTTNFDLPMTLVNAAEQSIGAVPDMDLDHVVNQDDGAR